MARGDSVWTEAAAHSDKMLQLVQDISPKQQIMIPTAHIHILGMFWRARRLYEGVLILLKAELPEEAAFLARALFEESLHLQQLAAEPEKRDALILGWYNRSIDEKQSLLKVAKQLGLDNSNIAGGLASLEQERDHLSDYARRHGVGKLHKFLSVREAAIRFGRKDDYWGYEWSHEFVHGTDVAWSFARRKVTEDTTALHAKTNDPTLRAVFAAFSAKSMLDALDATFAIFGWAVSPDLKETVMRLEALVEAARANKPLQPSSGTRRRADSK